MRGTCVLFVLWIGQTGVSEASSLRLVGSSSRCSGRVEVFHGGQWGTVCDDAWDTNGAQVVCRQVGCSNAVSAPGSAHFGEGTGQIWMDDVRCSGTETYLTDCAQRGFGEHNCGHGDDAGVVCQEASPLRLVGSSSRCSGRVEVFHGGQWGTVCDDAWNTNGAQVVCRQVGCSNAVSAPGSAHFGEGTGQIWMDDVLCSGNETYLTDCAQKGFGEHNCGHGEDAGVVCQDIIISTDSVRLEGGSSTCSGRIEALYRGNWRTVCAEGWDLNEARVVCRQIGCGSAVAASSFPHLVENSGQVWVNEVHCSGSESQLFECSHNTLGDHNCRLHLDAGVECQDI